MNDIVKDLQRLIVRSGLSAEQVGAMSNVSAQTINNLLAGRNVPRLTTMTGIAAAFGKELVLSGRQLTEARVNRQPERFTPPITMRAWLRQG